MKEFAPEEQIISFNRIPLLIMEPKNIFLKSCSPKVYPFPVRLHRTGPQRPRSEGCT